MSATSKGPASAVFDLTRFRPATRMELLHKVMRREAALNACGSDWQKPGRARFAALRVSHEMQHVLRENRTPAATALSRRRRSWEILYGPPLRPDDAPSPGRRAGRADPRL
jgi:hypothetical protein